MEEIVEPKRVEGFHVLSDRYDSSTVAFQIYGGQQHFEKLFSAIRGVMHSRYWPDAYIMLDLPAEVAFERRKKELEQAKTRFDLKPLEYHQRVRDGFNDFKYQFVGDMDMVHLVDANRPPEAIHKDIVRIVRQVIAS